MNYTLATHNPDGTTTEHPQAQQIFDEFVRPEFLANLERRLKNQYVPSLSANAVCVKCKQENPTDLPLCADCLAEGAVPVFKLIKCLICEKKTRLSWSAEVLPMTCGDLACVTKMASIAQALGQVA